MADGRPDRPAPRRGTDTTAAVLIAGLTVVISIALGAFFLALGRLDRYLPTVWWVPGWIAIAGYVAWWTVFFLASEEAGEYAGVELGPLQPLEQFVQDRVTTLPTFLEYNTPRVAAGETAVAKADTTANDSGATVGPKAAIEDLANKAGQTISTVSAIVGFALLLFSFTVNFLLSNQATLTGVETDLLRTIGLVQIVAIVAILIGMESLDTSMNSFNEMGLQERYRTTSAYYRTGIYYYYRGLAILVFSAFLFTMILHPLVTLVGTSVFAILGYDYWFGYVRGTGQG
ncbi:MAG: hypothetical protein ABEJ35_01140 [Halobacteriaceae archaeon]